MDVCMWVHVCLYNWQHIPPGWDLESVHPSGTVTLSQRLVCGHSEPCSSAGAIVAMQTSSPRIEPEQISLQG